LPLSEVNNAVLKTAVATMSEGGLSPKTIDNYAQVVKMVVSSAVNKEGEEIYPRKWNHEFIDMPIVEEAKQNTPCFSPEVMSGLATWKKERERMVFILCGAAGLRIGETLGLEIDKHISSDFLTISIEQKARHCKVEKKLKTASALRKVDLHPAIAARLPVLYPEWKAARVIQYPSPTPSPGVEAFGFHQPVHAHSQSRQPRIQAFPEHSSSESHRMSRGSSEVLDGARR
jgi:hypothetical protein